MRWAALLLLLLLGVRISADNMEGPTGKATFGAAESVLKLIPGLASHCSNGASGPCGTLRPLPFLATLKLSCENHELG